MDRTTERAAVEAGYAPLKEYVRSADHIMPFATRTWIDGENIVQVVVFRDGTTSQPSILPLDSVDIRRCLIDLGWTPPANG